MDLLRYTKYILADQFQVQRVTDDLLCVIGPFHLGDGQPIEVYLREAEEAIELNFYPGLAEVLTLEALHALGEEGQASALHRHGLELHPDRVSARTDRERFLEDLVRFYGSIQTLDRQVRAQA